jgi:hypothetical protein
VRVARKLVRMPLQRAGVEQRGVRNRELEELRRIIEELENRGNGETELDSDSEEDIEVEQNAEEGDSTVRSISLLSNKGSTRVEVSCYDGSMRAGTLIDWIRELERYFEYENVQDPNHVCFAIMKLK